jgi:hypothetical protein
MDCIKSKSFCPAKENDYQSNGGGGEGRRRGGGEK